MGSKTGKDPEQTDTPLWRICHALDETPKTLARNINVAYSELRPLLAEQHQVVDLDRDEVWWLIAEYVDKRTGQMMAIRDDLSRRLQRTRSKRLLRHAKLASRGEPPSIR